MQQLQHGEKLPIYQILRDAETARRQQLIQRQQRGDGIFWLAVLAIEGVLVAWILTI